MLPDEYYREVDALMDAFDASVGSLVKASVLDKRAFDCYRDVVDRFVSCSTSYSVVSKRALQTIRSSISLCESKVDCVDDPDFIREFCQYMKHAFGCVIGGEKLSDRKSGVPRIV